MEIERIFKKGDRIFSIVDGWGIIESDNGNVFKLYVIFDSGVEKDFMWNGTESEFDCNSLLSFTEYTFQGFSQQKELKLPERGQLCLVRTYNTDWVLQFFFDYSDEMFLTQDSNGETYKWNLLKRITVLD